MSTSRDASVPTLSSVFRTRGFALYFLANILSGCGDNIARVTIAFVVFQRTGSPLATATTFATSLLPTLLGRGLLAGIVDRFNPRSVLIGTHLIRALLTAGLVACVVEQSSITILLTVLFVLELAGGPAVVAGQVLITAWFPEREMFTRVFGLNTLASQMTQVLGLALGGALVAWLGARDALILDALTFLILAVVVIAVVPRRRVVDETGTRVTGGARDAWRVITSSRLLRHLILFGIVTSPAIVAPEALAIPYASSHAAGETWQGLLIAAPVAGSAIGVWWISRRRSAQQVKLMLPMALLTPLMLVPTVLHPGVPTVALIWLASGFCQAFMLPVQATFALGVDPERRGRVFGLAGAIAVGSSAIAYVLIGMLAQLTDPTSALLISAALTLVAVALIGLRWPHEVFEAAQTEAPRAVQRSTH